MFFVLPLTFIALVVVLIKEQYRWIEAYLKAVAVWCGLLLFQIELLSVLKMLDKITIFLYWGIVLIITTILIFRRVKKQGFNLKQLGKEFIQTIYRNKFFTLVFGGGIAISSHNSAL